MEEENFTFYFETPLPVSKKEAFDWHKREGMFERLTPPFVKMEILSKDHRLKLDDTIHCKFLLFHQMGVEALFKITEYIEGESFTDEQIKGPFSYWKHEHVFEDVDEGHCIIKDKVTFRVPLESFIGAMINSKIAKRLKCIFQYREQVLRNDLFFNQHYPDQKLHILMTGSSGLIGTALSNFLTVMGHIVTPITRHFKADEKGIFWDIENQKIDPEQLEDYDAVIHLAGENIAGLWTDHKKEKIYKSRIYSTKLLVSTFNLLKKPPQTLICASGGNFYQQGKLCNEEKQSGKGFLAQVIKDWEEEAQQYKKGRVALMRTGVVLSPKGGMLKKLLNSFHLGLGTKLGKGSQHLSWIALDDLVYQYYHVLMNTSLHGPINVAAPEPVTTDAFSELLAEVLNRPCFLRLPTGLVKTVFGEMGEETLLADIMIQPEKLIKSNSKFFFPKLKDALEHLLGSR